MDSLEKWLRSLVLLSPQLCDCSEAEKGPSAWESGLRLHYTAAVTGEQEDARPLMPASGRPTWLSQLAQGCAEAVETYSMRSQLSRTAGGL